MMNLKGPHNRTVCTLTINKYTYMTKNNNSGSEMEQV